MPDGRLPGMHHGQCEDDVQECKPDPSDFLEPIPLGVFEGFQEA